MGIQEVFEKIRYVVNFDDIPLTFRKLYQEQEKYRPFIDALLELQAYTKEPFENIIPRLKPDLVLREDWEKIFRQGFNEEKLAEFYEETTGFIYDCMANHTRPSQLQLLDNLAQICKENSLQKILDYGGGVGSLSIFLKRLGFEIIYADVYGETYKFASWRFAQRGLSIPMLRVGKDEIGGLDLDGIICLEVLEHLPDPIKLVRKFHDVLPDGKILICSAAFHALGHVSHLPENIKYAGEGFLKIMKEIGFEKIERYADFYPWVFVRKS